MNKSFMANAQNVERKWYVVDATDLVLGRLSTEVAAILRGKHKPTFTPHVLCGDCVIIVNAEKVALTGSKLDDKMYYRHSGYPGGLKKTAYKELMASKSDFVLEKAVKGMLPKNTLGKEMFKKLKVYKGAEHPHSAQQPKPYKLVGGVK